MPLSEQAQPLIANLGQRALEIVRDFGELKTEHQGECLKNCGFNNQVLSKQHPRHLAPRIVAV